MLLEIELLDVSGYALTSSNYTFKIFLVHKSIVMDPVVADQANISKLRESYYRALIVTNIRGYYTLYAELYEGEGIDPEDPESVLLG